MLKKIGIPFLLLLIVVGLFYLIVRPKPESEETAEKNRTLSSGRLKPTKPDEENPLGIDLHLNTMEITQGEGGFRLWRLQTKWASMQKEDGVIKAEKPELTYYMAPDNEELTVISDTGDVNQTTGILRFVDNVLATFDGRSIKGPLLVYNGTDKTMTFTKGGNFEGEGVQGSASVITWRMSQNVIEAGPGVHVLFQSLETGFENLEKH